jgi:hypothetical protein
LEKQCSWDMVEASERKNARRLNNRKMPVRVVGDDPGISTAWHHSLDQHY